MITMRSAMAFLLTGYAIAAPAEGLVLQPVPLGAGAYAVVADVGPPTYENGGINANLGFVVGREGVIVLDTGPSTQAAKALHDAIRRITPLPVKWVINTNSQPNRWLGNAYFRQLGVPILAHGEAIKLMRENGGMQFEGAQALLKEKFAGTSIAIADQALVDGRSFDAGGVELRIVHAGPAHTRGDVAVWLPGPRILFAGDIVYTERLLAVIPAGNSASWIRAFDAIEKLAPKTVVPGHGAPTDMARARAETLDYLRFLREAVKLKLDGGASVEEAVDKVDQSRFSRLANFAELSRRNAFQVYLELEFE